MRKDFEKITEAIEEFKSSHIKDDDESKSDDKKEKGFTTLDEVKAYFKKKYSPFKKKDEE